MAAPAQLRPHDVEAEEGERVVVIDAGDGRGRRAVDLADQKALGIDSGEALRVRLARIPALGRGPVGGERDLAGPQRANAEVVVVRQRPGLFMMVRSLFRSTPSAARVRRFLTNFIDFGPE
jgi:hypothetical protein